MAVATVAWVAWGWGDYGCGSDRSVYGGGYDMGGGYGGGHGRLSYGIGYGGMSGILRRPIRLRR
jgi:hypothetical protein